MSDPERPPTPLNDCHRSLWRGFEQERDRIIEQHEKTLRGEPLEAAASVRADSESELRAKLAKLAGQE